MKIIFKVVMKGDYNTMILNRFETLDEFDSLEEAEDFIKSYLSDNENYLAKYQKLFLQIEKRYYGDPPD